MLKLKQIKTGLNIVEVKTSYLLMLFKLTYCFKTHYSKKYTFISDHP